MIDIVIVNWNGGIYIQNCIASIIENSSKEILNKIFVIDNCSTDGSINNLTQYNKVEIIQNKENVGFAKACNQGFKLSKQPYVLLLNPDTQLFKTTLKDCIAFMNEHLSYDILGCQLLDDQGGITHSCARIPTPKTIFNDATGLSKLLPTVFKPSTLMTDWDHTASKIVPQVMGAFMFIRQSTFTKIGYFDEQFFVYYEELDYSYRLLQNGGTSFFNTSIKAIHSGEGTTTGVQAFRLFLNLQSRLKFANKHFSSFGYFFTKICTLIIEPFTRTCFLLLRGKISSVKDVINGYKLLYKSL